MNQYWDEALFNKNMMKVTYSVSPESEIFLDASVLKPLSLIIRKNKGSSGLRRVWKNVEECMCYEWYSYDCI